MNNKNEHINVKDVIQVDRELLDNISLLIDQQANASIKTIFADLHSADIAEIINHLKFDDAVYTFKLLDNETAGEVVPELNENLREKIFLELEPKNIAAIVDELETDDAADVVSDLPDEVAEKVLDKINPEDSEDVKELLQYDEETAGGLMNSDFVFVNENAKVSDAIEEVRKNSDEFEHIYFIYVLAEDEKLIGQVLLKSLLTNPPSANIKTAVEEDLIFVTPEIDQEEVADVMDKYDLVAIPVVDENKRMLGRITIDDVVDVIQEEASEDLQKFAGLSDDEEFSYSTVQISRNRMPWLFVSLFGEMISAFVLSSFQASLEKLIVSSFFIPIVMAMGGSAGSQAAIVMVQGMGTGTIRIRESFRKLFKEFRVAMLNGIISAVVLFALSHFIFHTEIQFSLILCVSLFLIMINATMVGASVPIILKRFGADPAIATGPFVQTSNDIFGLIIYLSLLAIFFTY